GFAHAPQNNRRPRQDFGHTRHGNVAQRDEADETLLLHAFAADPGDTETAPGTPAQRSDQGAAKHITGGFSSNQKNESRSGSAQERRTPTTNRPARSAARMT